jgi:hypothetical protein
MDYMKKAAAHLARQGRGPDTTLMHVSNREAGILGLLHPDGKLPHNPKTGLPEAGWFDTILPMVVGLGATALTGGLASPLVAAGAGGLASGATKAAMTGDLNQGIMTGMLSFGTGAALSGLGGADLSLGANPGATLGSASSAVPATAGAGIAGSAPMALPGAAPDLGGIIGSSGSMTMPAASDMANIGIQSTGSIAPSAAEPMTTAAAGSIAPSTAASTSPLGSLGDSYTKAYEGITGPNAGQYLKNTFITEAPKTTLPILLGGYGMMNQPTPLNVPKEPSDAELARRYPEQFPDSRTVVAPPADYVPGVSPEWNYFRPGMAEGGEVLMGNHDALYKEGGIASADPSAATKANIEAEAKMALLGEHPRAEAALSRYQDTFGSDALNSLTDKVRPPGGRIRGAGGGLDDLIPGTIEGRKQVRLADGEFVVPADVVSHLGDGSTDQGVRKLYEMMDRIRHSKTGSKKQPGPVKDGKVLPV